MRRLIALATAWLVSSCAVAASVTATWDHDGVDVDGFRLRYECQTRIATLPADAGARALTFDVPDGETCSARMWAYNGAGDSEPSNTVQFSTPPLERPGKVRNLKITWKEHDPEARRMASLVLNGTNAYASRTSALLTAAPISAFMWAKLDASVSGSTVYHMWSMGQSYSINNVFAGSFEQDAGNGVLSAWAFTRDASAWSGAKSPAAIPHSTWLAIGQTFASATSRSVYVNGGDKATNTASRVPSGINRFSIGALLRNVVANYFKGKIAHAAFWNVALTDQDHADLAAGALPSEVKGANLVAYYPGTVINVSGVDYLEDVSGNGNHLTLSGGWSVDTDDNPPVGDEDAPILTDPQATATGDGNTADVTVTTDEGNGTLRMVTTASAIKPSKSQMKAGQDHTGADALMLRQQAVPATGEQTIHTAVPIGTGRYFHLMHTDAAGNDSEVVTAGPFDTAFAELFFDNFARPDGPLNTNWDIIYGAPAIVGQQVVPGTPDEYFQSAAAVSTTALATVPQTYIVEIRASNFVDGSGEDAAGLTFGTTIIAGEVFAGMLLFLDGDSATLMQWDDVGESWTELASGPVTAAQAAGRVRAALAVDGSGNVRVTAYSMVDGAELLDYTVPAAAVPAYITEWRPGLGFYDENSSPLWVENYGVYGAPSGNYADLVGAGDAGAAFAARASAPTQLTAATSATSALAAASFTTEQASLTAAGAAGATLVDQGRAVAALDAAVSAAAAPAARADAVASLSAAGSAQATPEAIAHVVAGITAAGAASDSAGSAGRLVEQLVASGTGDAAFDSLGRATAALLAGAAAGESWATDLLALADLLAQAPAQSHFSPDSTELRTVDLDEAGAAAATLVTRADTSATLLAQLTAGAGVAGQATAREALTAALSALASWSADGRVLEQAELTLAGAAAAQLVAQTEGIEQAAMQAASPAAEVFLAAVHSYADAAAAGDAGAVILAVAAAQGAVTAAVEAQAQWAAQESANRAEVINDGAATAVLTPDAQAVVALLQSSPAMALLQAFAVTQEEASVTGAASALGTFRFASVVSGDFVAAVSTAGLFSPSAVLVRADLAEVANAAASFHAFYTAPVGQLTGSVHIIAAMAGSAQVTTALAGGVGVGPALGSSIH